MLSDNPSPPSLNDNTVALMLPQDTDVDIFDAGVMIFRPGSIAEAIIDAWIVAGRNCCDTFPAEQEVLNNKILPLFKQNIVRIHSGSETWPAREEHGGHRIFLDIAENGFFDSGLWTALSEPDPCPGCRVR